MRPVENSGTGIFAAHYSLTREEYAAWQVSVEERLELIDEIRAGEERERELRNLLDGMDDTLRTFEAMLTRDNDGIHNLRIQLHQCEARRALAPVRSATEDPQLSRFTADMHDACGGQHADCSRCDAITGAKFGVPTPAPLPHSRPRPPEGWTF